MHRYLALTSILLAALALVYLAGCKDKGNDAGGEGEGGEIKIGVFVELTGDVAEFGKATKEGVEPATEEINASGGINKSKIKLVIYDIRSDSGESTTAAKKLA